MKDKISIQVIVTVQYSIQLLYSHDLNTRLVQYSNGHSESDQYMLQFLCGNLITRLNVTKSGILWIFIVMRSLRTRWKFTNTPLSRTLCLVFKYCAPKSWYSDESCTGMFVNPYCLYRNLNISYTNTWNIWILDLRVQYSKNLKHMNTVPILRHFGSSFWSGIQIPFKLCSIQWLEGLAI